MAGSPSNTICGQGRGLPACQVSSLSVQPFNHNTPTLQTGQTGQTDRQTDNGLVAYCEPFYKLSPKMESEHPVDSVEGPFVLVVSFRRSISFGSYRALSRKSLWSFAVFVMLLCGLCGPCGPLRYLGIPHFFLLIEC